MECIKICSQLFGALVSVAFWDFNAGDAISSSDSWPQSLLPGTLRVAAAGMDTQHKRRDGDARDDRRRRRVCCGGQQQRASIISPQQRKNKKSNL